jgi:hypothetical protein
VLHRSRGSVAMPATNTPEPNAGDGGLTSRAIFAQLMTQRTAAGEADERRTFLAAGDHWNGCYAGRRC